MPIPTPSYGDLPDSVYEPAEDTFILLDALEQDEEDLRRQRPLIVLEIGSGSGIVSAAVAQLLRRRRNASTHVDLQGETGSEAKDLVEDTLSLTTDLNPDACRTTLATAAANGITLDPIRTDLIRSLSPRLDGQIDLLLFNPPYVPTEGEEVELTQRVAGVGATWAGGMDGMQVTKRVLDELPRLMSPHGRLYLVAVPENDPKGIIAEMIGKGFDGEIVIKRRAGRETLHVVRLIKRA